MRITIGSTLLFLLFISCEKIRINSPASIRQSFYLDGQYHESNEEIVVNRNYRYDESVWFPEKYCDFEFLLVGTALTNKATAQYPVVTFDISLNPGYSQNEWVQGCFCLPKTTVNKLYDVITSPYGWNQNNSDKYLYCFYQTSSDYAAVYGADILSKKTGNSLLFKGHIDSMICHTSGGTHKISDFNFEYLVPPF